MGDESSGMELSSRKTTNFLRVSLVVCSVLEAALLKSPAKNDMTPPSAGEPTHL